MGYTTIYNNIIFIEGDEPAAKKTAFIKCDLSFKIGAQLKSLNDVKANLALKAAKLNCNAITNFEYGQKSRWLAIDDVGFWGNGFASVLPEQTVTDLLQKIKNR